MVAGASGGKTEEGKTGIASTEQKQVPLQLLKKITNNFSDERILRHSTHGILYKGIMEDGEVIIMEKFAKKLRGPQVEHVMALRHENVVQFIGFFRGAEYRPVKTPKQEITVEIRQTLLCYEYLPKGSLQKNLYEEPISINWETRFKIIKGICQGLLFIHSIPNVHMNLNPGNIMLDNNMRPIIAEWVYSSRLSDQLYPKRLDGRSNDNREMYAYMAPEYLYRGEISARSDIYSLGLLIIEISTRAKASIRNIKYARSFVDSVRENWTDEYIMLEYPTLDEDYCLEQISGCIHIGLQCMEIDQHKRPSIQKIVHMLDGLSQIGSDSLLSLQPRRINFPTIKSKRLTSSSLYLINRTDDRIAFRLITKTPRRYRTKLPICGIVLPKCTCTLNVITPEQKKASPSDSDDSLTLQSSIARNEDLEDVDPASVDVFLDATGDEVQEVKVVVACDPLAETASNQIIDGQNYREVLSIDVHPTKPWILTSNKKGYVCIWNYHTQEEVDSIEVTTEPVYSVKFIEREEWFVVGSGDGCIGVYNCNNMEEVVDPIEAHDSHGIMCLAVNPTHSYVLSASDDHTIKIWDWAKEWQCIGTFEGHNHTVTQVMFDPMNSESFASASLDQTVKIWDIRSETCNITWDGHPEGLLCLHYHPRYFQQFLISGSSDGDAKVWDLETDTCVDTLQGHGDGLKALCWHPELRVLVTGSLDGTVRIWNWKLTSSTYRLENIIRLNLGAVNALGYLKGSTRIVVGCDQGIALMEINVM